MNFDHRWLKYLAITLALLLLLPGALAAMTTEIHGPIKMKGPIAMGGHNITGLGNGTANQDVFTVGQGRGKLNKSGIKSLDDFGAIGDGITDDTAAFEAANASMVSGEALIIPAKIYKVSSVTWAPPDACSLICLGKFLSDTDGTAFTIGLPDQNRWWYTISGLRVVSSARDWTGDRAGVDILNLVDADLHLTYTTGFTYGVRVLGENNLGNAYNEISPGEILDCKHGLVFGASNGGWCNEHNVYGGRFGFTSSLPDYTGCEELNITYNSVHKLNNIRFYGPCFESNNNTVVPANISGWHCFIYNARREGPGNFVLGKNSYYCGLLYGFGVFRSAVTNLAPAHANVILSAYDQTFAGSSASEMMLVYNVASSNYKSLTIADSSGNPAIDFYGNGSIISKGGFLKFENRTSSPAAPTYGGKIYEKANKLYYRNASGEYRFSMVAV
jgi:hypothetical protein